MQIPGRVKGRLKTRRRPRCHNLWTLKCIKLEQTGICTLWLLKSNAETLLGLVWDWSTINSQTCNQIKSSFGVRSLYSAPQVSVVVVDMTYRFNTVISKHCQGWYAHLTGNREHTDPVIDTHMRQMARSTWSSTQTTWIQRAELCGSMWRGAPGNEVINDRARVARVCLWLTQFDPQWWLP